jgi:uncharacterized protein
MNPLDIIKKYYDPNSDAYRILVNHSLSVRDKAISIAIAHPELNLDLVFIDEASMLHDIGVFMCNAPEIDCHGSADYICHGYLGAELMRKECLPRHARVCERHTGTGLTKKMIEKRKINIPPCNYLPKTMEEQLICFSDKFFSKTKLGKEKSIIKIQSSMEKYGKKGVIRFNEWCKLFLG